MSRQTLLTTHVGLGCLSICVTVSALFVSVTATQASQPLQARIDTLIRVKHTGPVAKRCTDAEFLRRVMLDLNGTIPTSPEARAFIDDTSPDKREKLIDRLLNSPRYIRHMANVFDLILMERRKDKHVKSPEWQQYLHQSFAANKPYNQLAREILGADGVDAKLRPAAKFYLDREGEVNLLTRDVGRIFFGMDLQCAQCHDHPLVDSYLQADYYGLYAFLNRSFVFTDSKKKNSFFAEKAEGAVTFKSVFTGDAGKTRPRVPGGVQLVEPLFTPGDEYTVKPAKNVRPIPKYSRRKNLAETTTSSNNLAFQRNIVNRLWAHMMGRGLVHPVDFHHPDNPPSHPELLDLMAGEFVAMKYDIKAFLRVLALTDTYQNSFDLPQKIAEQVQTAAKQVSVLDLEVQALTTLVEKSEQLVSAVESELEPHIKAADQIQQELDKAIAAVAAAQKKHDGPAKALATSQQQLSTKQSVAKVVADAAAKAQEAVKQLPGEKELAAALKTLQSRSGKLNSEVETLKKTVSQKTAAAKPTSDALAASKQTAAKINPRMTEALKAATPIREKIAAAMTKSKIDLSVANASQQRMDELRAFVEYGNLVTDQHAAEKSLVSLETKFAALQKMQTEDASDLKRKQALLAEAQKIVAQTTASLNEVQKQLAAKKRIAIAVNEASEKVNAVIEMAPDTLELAEAAEQYAIRAEQLNQNMDSIQQQVALRNSESKTASELSANRKTAIVTATAAISITQKMLDSLNGKIGQAKSHAKTAQTATYESLDKLSEKWTNRFVVGPIRPLSPESLAWSVMQSTGMAQRQHVTEEAALKKKDPKAWEAANADSRARQLEEAVYNKLKGNVKEFVTLFGAGSGVPQEEFFATVDQALFLSNAGRVRGWVAPSGGNLADRLNKLEDPKAFAEELYLSVLTRRPLELEVAYVKQYLQKRTKDRAVATGEIIWALLTSTEFRFNH
jgi:hypothetical protein